MTLFRPHRATLYEAMEEVRSVETRADLQRYFDGLFFPATIGSIEPYAPGADGKPLFDERIGWHTYIVVDTKGHVLGFTNGPLPTETETQPLRKTT